MSSEGSQKADEATTSAKGDKVSALSLQNRESRQRSQANRLEAFKQAKAEQSTSMFVKSAVQLISQQSETRRSLRRLNELVKKSQRENKLSKELATSMLDIMANMMGEITMERESIEAEKAGWLHVYGWKGDEMVLDTFWAVLLREDACLRLYKKEERGLKEDSVTGHGPPTGATGNLEGPSAAVSVAKGLPPPHPGPPSQSAAEVAPMLGLAKGLDFGLQALRSAKLPSFGSLANLNNLNLSWFAKEDAGPIEVPLDGCQCRKMSGKSLGKNSFEIVDRTKNTGRAFKTDQTEDCHDWIDQITAVSNWKVFNVSRELRAASCAESYRAAFTAPLRVPIGLLRRVIGDSEHIANQRRNSGNLPVAQVGSILWNTLSKASDEETFDDETTGSNGVARYFPYGMRSRHIRGKLIWVVRDVERDQMYLNGVLLNGSDGIDYVLGSLALSILESLNDPTCVCVRRLKEARSAACAASSISNFTTKNGFATSTWPQRGRAAGHAGIASREVHALAFAERILRGTTRTQSGGDVFDAVTAVCRNKLVTICPVSRNAEPMVIDIGVEDGELVVRTTSNLSFKLMPVEADDTAEAWAFIRGTIERVFVFGRQNELGTVVIEQVQEGDSKN